MDFNKLASQETITKTMTALKANGFEPIHLSTKEEALAKIKELIPAGVSVMNGASVTLEQVGYIALLKSKDHKWNNLHEAVLAEPDKAKQALLRRQSVLSDYYLGSVHALTENGEMVIASNTGSQLPHLVFTSPNLLLIVGAQKIVPTINDGLQRIEEYILPLEDKHMQSLYGSGTQHSKTVILRKENKMMGRKVNVIIVDEILGF